MNLELEKKYCMPKWVRNTYRIGLAIGLALILFGPFIFIFGPHLTVLGVLWLLALGLIYGVHAFISRLKRGVGGKSLAVGLVSACGAILLFLAYTPSYPDACSRAYSDTQYEICLEEKFTGMTVSEARQWLTDNGYTVGRRIEMRFGAHSRDPRHSNDPNFKPDFHFSANRRINTFTDTPYGTNFNRIFGGFVVPGGFEMEIYGDSETDTIVAVNVWWGREFL